MEWLVYWHWFTLALILIIAEILGAAGFLLALGMAAATTGLITWLIPISWQWQFVIFSTLCLAYAFAWWQYLNSRAQLSPSLLNRPLEDIIGRTTDLVEPIVNGRGKIQINGTFWFVTGPELPVGTKVTITAVQGDTLVVEAA